MRLLAIGDIHGCRTALDALLDAVSPGADDTVITLGDYVDRGPDSKGVVDRLIEIRARLRLVAVLGNHEQMMLDDRHEPGGGLWAASFGAETLASYGLSSGEVDRIPAEHWEFFEEVCVDYHETDRHIFSHAAVRPGLPLEEQPVAALRWDFLDPIWTGPHCSGKTVVCGHSTQKSGRPLHLGHTICIDTCPHGGGWLTCLDAISGSVWQAGEDGRVRTARIDDFRGELRG